MSADSGRTTDRARPRFARFYVRMSAQLETEGLAELRDELLDGLAGDVAEVGCGNGTNFGHYPPSVRRVVAIEPEPFLRERARLAAKTRAADAETRAADAAAAAAAAGASAPAALTIDVRPGLADRLPLPDASVDAAVLCLVMCAFDDRPAALAELRRVLRLGGELRFLEHTAAETRGLRAAQRIADATFWPRLSGGCRTAVDPAGAIEAAGFTITSLRRLRFPPRRFTNPSTPHVLGTAVVPAMK